MPKNKKPRKKKYAFSTVKSPKMHSNKAAAKTIQESIKLYQQGDVQGALSNSSFPRCAWERE